MMDYDKLFRLLATKTQSGKLKWQETAKEGAFIVAVNGVMVFRIESTVLCWKAHPQAVKAVTLEAIDEHGDSLFHVVRQSRVARAALTLAKHSAARPHVDLAEAILLLEGL
jgi:hypothetical protein